MPIRPTTKPKTFYEKETDRGKVEFAKNFFGKKSFSNTTRALYNWFYNLKNN